METHGHFDLPKPLPGDFAPRTGRPSRGFDEGESKKRGEGCARYFFTHGCSPKTIGPRIPIKRGRRTSGFTGQAQISCT